MRIVIFTSNQNGVINEFNIAELITNRPSFDYTFVSVNKIVNEPSFLYKLKQLLIEIRDGRNFWVRDNNKLKRIIKKKIKAIDLKKINTINVTTVNSKETERIIKELKPDIIYQAGAGILKSNIFELATIGTINLHHGFSPNIRGISSTFWCLYYGLTDEIGVTCHFIDKNLDTGDIILREKYNYKEYDTYIGIQAKLCDIGADILVKSVDILEKNKKMNTCSKEVKSYYFSNVPAIKYNQLRSNQFIQIQSEEELLSKIKIQVELTLQ